jgi:transcriptional regulatory protein RtcR
MATLADAGRITEALVDEEIARLRKSWGLASPQDAAADALGEAAGELDLFDRLQLNAVLAVCQQADSLSDAGRRLFAVSRQDKKVANDADRLRKYLARFGLDWQRARGGR